jgi:hypothetical protein
MLLRSGPGCRSLAQAFFTTATNGSCHSDQGST